MKSLLKYFFKDIAKNTTTASKETSSNSKDDFEFKIISTEERVKNRCDKYEFIIK